MKVIVAVVLEEEEEAGKVQEYKEEGSLSENENNNTAEINNVKPDGMNNVNVGSKKLNIVIKQEGGSNTRTS